MPIVLFIIIAIICQAVNLTLCLAIEKFVSSGASVTVFALLYMVAFWVAWKITVWLVDTRFQRMVKSEPAQFLVLLAAFGQVPMMV